MRRGLALLLSGVLLAGASEAAVVRVPEQTAPPPVAPPAPPPASKPVAPKPLAPRSAISRPERPAEPPAPALDPETAGVTDFITAALVALKAGRTKVAMEMIEQAQTRLLDRSVELNKTFDPIEDSQVTLLTLAKQAMAARDLKKATELLQDLRKRPASAAKD